jgi:hypothetical protein
VREWQHILIWSWYDGAINDFHPRMAISRIMVFWLGQSFCFDLLFICIFLVFGKDEGQTLFVYSCTFISILQRLTGNFLESEFTHGMVLCSRDFITHGQSRGSVLRDFYS